jgi:hypothetical protein
MVTLVAWPTLKVLTSGCPLSHPSLCWSEARSHEASRAARSSGLLWL